VLRAPTVGLNRALARRVGIADDQRDLGTAEHHGVAAGIAQACDDALMVGDRLRGEHAAHQFVHDDVVDRHALIVVRDHVVQSCRVQPVRIDPALHQPARSQHPKATEAARRRFGYDHVRDVQPG